MYIMRCDNCGWKEERESVLITKCPDCNYPLIIDTEADEDITPIDTEEDEGIVKELKNKEYSIKKKFSDVDIVIMKAQIGILGNNFVWNKIEKIINSYERIEDRQLFFEAGGVMPERSK